MPFVSNSLRFCANRHPNLQVVEEIAGFRKSNTSCFTVYVKERSATLLPPTMAEKQKIEIKI